MTNQGQTVRPLVETVAGSIGDPVRRLRFLMRVAPLVDVHGERRRRRRKALLRAVLALAVLAAGAATFSLMRATPRAAMPPPPPPPRTISTAAIWQVEQGESDTYSNGLRIDNTYAVSNRPRNLRQPAGIVFHATESAQAPFEEEHNDSLKRIGESLLDYVRRRRSYHFLIDRFGRVFRVVQEADVAHHAGHSVWGDDRSLYIGLNETFLGVAFEARDGLTAAQVRSGAMLTELLRAVHKIPAENCVTHAQVSVNPSNMRVGYHVDWAAGLPFSELGLPDNYAIPPPAIWSFGFEADAVYVGVAGESLRRALDAARAAAQPGGRGRYRDLKASGSPVHPRQAPAATVSARSLPPPAERRTRSRE